MTFHIMLIYIFYPIKAWVAKDPHQQYWRFSWIYWRNFQTTDGFPRNTGKNFSLLANLPYLLVKRLSSSSNVQSERNSKAAL